MVLLHVSAAKGSQSDGVMKTLILGISILRGGNVDVQAVRLLIIGILNEYIVYKFES